jgi:serine-type D-Ala-D-Ala carboxypeptidase
LIPAPNHANHAPCAAFEQQDQVFHSAFAILEQAVVDRVVPGAAVAVTFGGKLVALKAVGRFTYDLPSPPVLPTTMYDLASVTKVLATTTMAMILYQRGELDLEMPLAAVISEFVSDDSRRQQVTIRHLLAHSSGLPAYEKLFLRAHSRNELLAAAYRVPLTADPGTRAEYSDIGFIILGEALARIADTSLDDFCRKEIFGPLGMAHTTFNPPATLRSEIPPTVDDRTFRKRIVQGEVNDENASVLGGVAGHAGVFSSASDIATFAHAMLNGGNPILRPETVALFTRRDEGVARTFLSAKAEGESPVSVGSGALGWDTPSPPSQSGSRFSQASFGHLGYTGTSLWIDPERRLSVTLLTNRTCPDSRNQAIKQLRPQFHDAIVEALQ